MLGLGLAHILGLSRSTCQLPSRRMPCTSRTGPAFPPSTSSPIIRQAAVWIFLEARSLAVLPVAIAPLTAVVARPDAADGWARLGSGRERWRATWDRRENMKLSKSSYAPS